MTIKAFCNWRTVSQHTQVQLVLGGGLCLGLHFTVAQWFLSWHTLLWHNGWCLNTYPTWVQWFGSCLTVHLHTVACAITKLVYTSLWYSGLCLDMHFIWVQWCVSWHTLHWDAMVCIHIHFVGYNHWSLDTHFIGVQWFVFWYYILHLSTVVCILTYTLLEWLCVFWHTLHWKLCVS